MAGCRDSLKNYTCIVDNLESALDKVHSSMTPIKWSRSKHESLHYKPLAIFLNQFVQASHGGLDADPNFAIKKADRWYADLSFVIVEPPLHDEPEESSSVPALAGVLNFKDGDTLVWPPHDGNKLLQIPVAMGQGWMEVVLQAYIYAQQLFYDSPLRQFALLIGYDYAQMDLRILVFYRGGLTASHALSVKTDTKDILRLFMAIGAWSSPSDAGFPEWCNSTQFPMILKAFLRHWVIFSTTNLVCYEVLQELLGSWSPTHLLVHDPIEDRVLHSCSAEFGTPKHYFS